MEEKVSFKSGDLTLSGVVHRPDDMTEGERRPAVLVLHGFGSRKDAGNVTGPTNMFINWGYVVLRFDMRGCGESGERSDRPLSLLTEMRPDRTRVRYMYFSIFILMCFVQAAH